MPPTAFCPTCRANVPFTLHGDRVTPTKKIAFKPILPACLVCGGDVQIALLSYPRPCRLIALTGACAGGKSTTAEALVARHGFTGIDGWFRRGSGRGDRR